MLQVAKTVIDLTAAFALEDFPLETCGLLIGTEGRILSVERTRNVAPNKQNRYAIDPFEMIQIEETAYSKGLDVLGTFHSHPDNSQTLSSIDLASALSNWYYLLVSTDGVNTSITFWKLNEKSFQRLDFEIIDA